MGKMQRVDYKIEQKIVNNRYLITIGIDDSGIEDIKIIDMWKIHKMILVKSWAKDKYGNKIKMRYRALIKFGGNKR